MQTEQHFLNSKFNHSGSRMINRRSMISSSMLTIASTLAHSQASEQCVVLVPGFGGSVLSWKSGEIWSASLSSVAKLLTPDSVSARKLSTIFSNNSDGVTATRVIDDAYIFPGMVKSVTGYTALRDLLVSRMGYSQGKNYFEFAYDWRRDCRSNAHLLAQYCKNALSLSGASGGERKLVLIAHSMGGLVSRYALDVLGLAPLCSKFFTLGTPFRGSVQAVATLTHGVRVPGIEAGGLLRDVFRQFDSTYQLLPHYECVVDSSGERKSFESVANIFGVDVRRVQSGRQIHEEMEKSNSGSRQYSEFNVIGSYMSTPQYITFQDGRGSRSLGGYFYTYDTDPMQGDGTVTRSSAISRNTSAVPFFVLAEHGDLPSARSVHAQIQGISTPIHRDSDFSEKFSLRCLSDVVSSGHDIVADVVVPRLGDYSFTSTNSLDGTENILGTLKLTPGVHHEIKIAKAKPGMNVITAASSVRDTRSDYCMGI